MFWFAARTSRERGANHYHASGCEHFSAWIPDERARPESECHAFVVEWNAEAERLFLEKTARLTAEERLSWRIRLFGPVKPAPQPAKA